MKNSFRILVAAVSALSSAAVSAREPQPAPPGPEAWTFKEELAAWKAPSGMKPVGEGKTPWLEDRVSRCFFSPINRPPLFRDELTDDVDYYPDAYLKRLQLEGVNGLWLSIKLADFAKTSFTEPRADVEKRIAKLNKTVKKLAKYGIKLWLWGNEPFAMMPDDPLLKAHPEFGGASFDWTPRICFCPSEPKVLQYLEEAFYYVYSHVPGLGGFINISNGEGLTTCLSAIPCNPVAWTPHPCRRCADKKPWQLHYLALEAMAKGMRRAEPDAKILSWFYQPEANPSRREWVYECARHQPEGVKVMFNFESGGVKDQMGLPRCGGDYWLSYPGPAAPFSGMAAAARETGNPIAAKIQVSTSHEMATLPYIPAPGLLYRKYKGMHDAGVTSAMMCWYFGSYPGLMNRAAGMLAYSDFKETEAEFLERLAADEWGEDAPKAAKLWELFTEAYLDYPFSNTLQYWGPFATGVAWPLRPFISAYPQAASWIPGAAKGLGATDDVGGDAILCALGDFTIEEAAELSARMAAKAREALPLLDELSAKYRGDRARELDLSVMRAYVYHLEAAADVFRFYLLRSEAVYLSRVAGRSDEAAAKAAEMHAIARRQVERGAAMKKLCENDSRLGFHSEAEAHLYYPSLFDWQKREQERIEKDFKIIEPELAAGRSYWPSDFEKSAAKAVLDGNWIEGGRGLKWRATERKDGAMEVEIKGNAKMEGLVVAMTDAAATLYPIRTYIRPNGEILLFKTKTVRYPEDPEGWSATFENGEKGDWTARMVYPPVLWRNDPKHRPELFAIMNDTFPQRQFADVLWPDEGGRCRNHLNLPWCAARLYGRLVRKAGPSALETLAQQMKIVRPRPALYIPSRLYAVPGIEFNIYWANVTDALNPAGCAFDTVCEVGRNESRRFTWTPTAADVGRNIELTVRLLTDEGVKDVARTVIAVSAPPAKSGKDFSVALLSDSTTNGRYQDQYLRRFREAGADWFRAVGSRSGCSAAPIGEFHDGEAAHDGYGGFSWKSFLTQYKLSSDELDNTQAEAEKEQLKSQGVEIVDFTDWRKWLTKSPLITLKDGKKTLDAQAWFDRINGGKAPSVIIIRLGGNDFFTTGEDLLDHALTDMYTEVSREIDELVALLRKAAPETVIAIGTVEPGCADQNAFARNYGAYRLGATFRRSQLVYNRMVEAKIALSPDPKLMLLPMGHAIDPIAGYPTDPNQLNALHFTPAGGARLGDAIYAFLLSLPF